MCQKVYKSVKVSFWDMEILFCFVEGEAFGAAPHYPKNICKNRDKYSKQSYLFNLTWDRRRNWSIVHSCQTRLRRRNWSRTGRDRRQSRLQSVPVVRQVRRPVGGLGPPKISLLLWFRFRRPLNHIATIFLLKILFLKLIEINIFFSLNIQMLFRPFN